MGTKPETTLTARVCPECGGQNTRDTKWLGEKATYCLNHEDEDRTYRPEHVTIEVVPLSELVAEREWSKLQQGVAANRQGEIERLRAELEELLKELHDE
jgi:hypothetical protein